MAELDKDLPLYEAVLGQRARTTTDADAVIAALRAGETGLPVEIPGDTPETTRHLMLAGISEDTIRYAESPGAGPPKEPSGWKTMTIAELRGLLGLPGAAAMLFRAEG